MTIGRVCEILEPQSSSSMALIVVEKFDIGSKHRRLYMPTINRPQEPVFILAHIQVEFHAFKLPFYSFLTSLKEHQGSSECTTWLRARRMWHVWCPDCWTTKKRDNPCNQRRQTYGRRSLHHQHAQPASTSHSSPGIRPRIIFDASNYGPTELTFNFSWRASEGLGWQGTSGFD